jgi:hypothetical protein
MSAPEHMLRTHMTAKRMYWTVLCIGFDSAGFGSVNFGSVGFGSVDFDCCGGGFGGLGEAGDGEGDCSWMDIVCYEMGVSCCHLQLSIQ